MYSIIIIISEMTTMTGVSLIWLLWTKKSGKEIYKKTVLPVDLLAFVEQQAECSPHPVFLSMTETLLLTSLIDSWSVIITSINPL